MDPRNVAPQLNAARFWAYVAIIMGGGSLIVALSFHRLPAADLARMGAPLFVVLMLLLATELRPLIVPGSTEANGITTSTAFVFALLLAFGMAPAILAQSSATLVSDRLKHRAWWRTGFNVSQYALSWTATAAVLTLLGVHGTPLQPLYLRGEQIPAIIAAAVTYFVVNDGLVSIALALRGRVPLRSELFRDFRYQAAATGSLLAMGPLVVVVMQRSALLVPLFLLPLFAVYATAAISVQKEHQAHHDPLTGLANRKLLATTAGSLLADAARHNTGVALCLLDLDAFKLINDTHGHHVGDLVLQAVASRLRAVLRPGDILARLGGDEFVILVPYAGDPDLALRAAHRISDALTEPLSHNGKLVPLQGSLGIALYPAHGDELAALLRYADAAMYDAKRSGHRVALHRHSSHPETPFVPPPPASHSIASHEGFASHSARNP